MRVREQSMTERLAQTHESKAIETVVKSGLTGVAATVLAAAVFSPAGFGGMIGTSLAHGGDASNSSRASQDPYSVLPAYPAPLSAQELDAIHSQLAQTAASLEFTRAATDARIERIRSLVTDDGLVTFATTRVAQAAPAPVAQVQPREELRLALSEPVVAFAPIPARIEALPISYGGGVDASVPYSDPHLELAELFLAHAPS
jgi:hypothetical protein